MAATPENLLEDWERAANSRDFDSVVPFIAPKAEFHFTNGDYFGLDEIRGAFEATWHHIQEEVYTLSELRWIGRTPTLAVCAYNFTSDGIVDGQRQVYQGHGTNVLECIGGAWQIIYEHLSKLPDAE